MEIMRLAELKISNCFAIKLQRLALDRTPEARLATELLPQRAIAVNPHETQQIPAGQPDIHARKIQPCDILDHPAPRRSGPYLYTVQVDEKQFDLVRGRIRFRRGLLQQEMADIEVPVVDPVLMQPPGHQGHFCNDRPLEPGRRPRLQPAATVILQADGPRQLIGQQKRLSPGGIEPPLAETRNRHGRHTEFFQPLDRQPLGSGTHHRKTQVEDILEYFSPSDTEMKLGKIALPGQNDAQGPAAGKVAVSFALEVHDLVEDLGFGTGKHLFQIGSQYQQAIFLLPAASIKSAAFSGRLNISADFT